MRVKICAITNLDDALAACDAGADALGFNFAIEAKRKNRFIEPEAARRIVEALPPFITTVAICVNDPAARIMEYLQFVDTVQLHGEETPAQCAAIGGRAIKAFRAGGDFQPESMLAYPTSAYLLDAQVAGARGGTGTVGDWDMARAAVALERPIILAGGLTPENVAEAVKYVRPYGVDTAGGVESAPGIKDHERTRDFIRNAKAAIS
ncbi:MAG: phosphoribosylanthranilate isomerase [Candidatus Hydrogenedentes bacterium]|jgi:phosphoribosylanthranilate isomerase|nr:phosphoribosylanthranilate isomerase [Candidatus Hydrogenedentota bacterium]